jgi:hypothetical protein
MLAQLMSDQERGEADPVIRLRSARDTECHVLVRARYEAAGRGLMLFLRSETPGVIPPTELEWEDLGEDSIDEEPPKLPELHRLSFKAGELSQFLQDIKHAFQRLGPTRDPHAAADLKKAIAALSKLLQRTVSSSSAEEWSIAAQSPSAEALAEMLARLAFLLEIGGREATSPVLHSTPSAYRRPAGKVDLSMLRKDSQLQFQLHTCLGRFAAAAPDSFVKHCLHTIETPRIPLSLRQACIYSIGRTAGTFAKAGIRSEAAAQIFAAISRGAADGSLTAPEAWKEFGWWTRALAFYLAGNPWQVSELPVTNLEAILRSLADAMDQLSGASCDDDNVWSSILVCLLFLRYAMRIPGSGVREFGPKSDLARRIVRSLELAARSSVVQSVARVNLRRFVQNPEVLQGDNCFIKVANIWQGKAAGVLLRASVEDE